MSTTLQIRNVPNEVHAAVRLRAAGAGLSVSDCLLDLVRELVTRPTMPEIEARTTNATGNPGTAAPSSPHPGRPWPAADRL